MGQANNTETFERVVDTIRQTFPSLQFETDYDHPQLDALVTIPVQTNLRFGMSVYLDNDELLLTTNSFHMEWFPCTNEKVVDDYAESICGLISGTFRIVEYSREGVPFKARLDR